MMQYHDCGIEGWGMKSAALFQVMLSLRFL